PKDPRYSVERELLKLAVQSPALVGPAFATLEEADFTHPAYRAIRRGVAEAAGAGTAVGGAAGAGALNSRPSADEEQPAPRQTPELPGIGVLPRLLTALAVEAPHSVGDPEPRYAAALVARLQELSAGRRIAEIKSRLQRLNPVENEDEHMRLFAELVALEQHRQALRTRAAGSLD